MKTTALLFITLSSLMTGVLHAAQPLKLAGSRPNILFILTDDQGKGDLSARAMIGFVPPTWTHSGQRAQDLTIFM